LQVNPHAPAAQVAAPLAGAGQLVPHAPQWAAVVRVSVSQPLAAMPSQLPNPVAQVSPHAPAAHAGVALAPPGHAVPQRPQLATSVCVLVSQPAAAVQSPKPATHAKPHALAAHVAVAFAGAGQLVPHAPQWAAVVRVSVSQPLAAMPSQLPKPVTHAKPHALAAHVGVAFAGVAQIVPHAPQLVADARVSTSQPFAATPSQSAKPMAQTKVHADAAQRGEALAGAGHALPQRLQLVADVRVSVSQPLARLPSHSAKPALHAKLQTRATQLAVPLAGAAHAVPHAPQCAGSVARSTQLVPHRSGVAPEQPV
jgi:hypothetical protein